MERVTTWEEIERHDLYWLLRINEAMSVHSEMHDYSLQSPNAERQRTQHSPAEIMAMAQLPDDGVPRGGRFVGSPIAGRSSTRR
jgi:hypothetical protein